MKRLPDWFIAFFVLLALAWFVDSVFTTLWATDRGAIDPIHVEEVRPLTICKLVFKDVDYYRCLHEVRHDI